MGDGRTALRRSASVAVALVLLLLAACVGALIVVAPDGRTPAQVRGDVAQAAAEYVAACEREHRSWCRECE